MKSVLVVGNIHGKFKQFFEKVKKLNEKNKFDFILCVG
jgi:predicted phosphodiesterase